MTNRRRFPTADTRDFADNLGILARRGDRASLAELRRFADGRHPTVRSWTALAQLGAPIGDRRVEDFAFVAGLFALYHGGSGIPVRANGNLGASFAALARRDHNSAEAAERRLQELLGLDRVSLSAQLRRAVMLLSSRDVPIDWAALVADLADWGSPDRVVQEAWVTALVEGWPIESRTNAAESPSDQTAAPPGPTATGAASSAPAT